MKVISKMVIAIVFCVVSAMSFLSAAQSPVALVEKTSRIRSDLKEHVLSMSEDMFINYLNKMLGISSFIYIDLLSDADIRARFDEYVVKLGMKTSLICSRDGSLEPFMRPFTEGDMPKKDPVLPEQTTPAVEPGGAVEGGVGLHQAGAGIPDFEIVQRDEVRWMAGDGPELQQWMEQRGFRRRGFIDPRVERVLRVIGEFLWQRGRRFSRITWESLGAPITYQIDRLLDQRGLDLDLMRAARNGYLERYLKSNLLPFLIICILAYHHVSYRLLFDSPLELMSVIFSVGTMEILVLSQLNLD